MLIYNRRYIFGVFIGQFFYYLTRFTDLNKGKRFYNKKQRKILAFLIIYDQKISQESCLGSAETRKEK